MDREEDEAVSSADIAEGTGSSRFWLGLLLALLLARAVRALFSTLFYQSLATFRLNESAWWMLVLLAPAFAPLLGRRGLLATVALAGISTTALVFTRFTSAHVPVAALATVCGLLASTRAAAMGGALVGLALDGALLTLGASLEPSTALLPLAVGIAAAALAWRSTEAPHPRGASWAAGAACAALLALELAFLASPYALSRWLGTPAWLAAAAGGIGLVVGATRLRAAGAWLWLAGALSLVDVAIARSPFAPLSLAILQGALGAAAARIAPALATRGGAIAFGLAFAPLAFTLLYFRSPLGVSEWGALVPLLAALAAAPAVFAARPIAGRRRMGAAPAAALLALSAIAAAMPAPIAEPTDDGAITAVTWNIHQAFGNRGALDPRIYADVLRSLEPDIVFLQETDTARLSSGHLDIVQFLARDLDMHAAFGRSGAAVLSRYPIADAERTPEADWTYEVALDVDGTTVWARSVHLAIGRLGNRSAQVDELVADPHPGPHIIAGDLNLCGLCPRFQSLSSGTLNPQYEALVSRYTDAWVAAGHALDDPDGVTFRLPNPQRRIDHILTEGFTVLEASVIHDERTRAASDHLPVVARLRLLEA